MKFFNFIAKVSAKLANIIDLGVVSFRVMVVSIQRQHEVNVINNIFFVKCQVNHK